MINEWPSSSQEDNVNTPHHWSRRFPSSLYKLRAWTPAWSHRGLAALPPEAVAAGHQVVAVWRNVAVGLDVLLGWESVGHLPSPAVPHPETTTLMWPEPIVFPCVTLVKQPHTIIVQIVYCDVSIQLREISLCLPYGLILRGLDHRGAARHPTHMGHLKMNRIE